MEILLNEKSLEGQFPDLDSFYETLPVMSKNLKILRTLEIPLLKHSSLYSRKIKELEELIIALDRFEASSWKEIWQDN